VSADTWAPRSPGETAQLDLDGYDDPSRLWSLHFVPLADAGNRVSGGMVLCRDVTEQRQAEQRRKEPPSQRPRSAIPWGALPTGIVRTWL